MAKATTAMAKYDAELAALATAAAEQEANTGGGPFFSVRGGQLKLNDSPLPNNEMAVVILDSVLENVYYGADYDPDNPQAPKCYAFGRDEKVLAPHAEASEKQADGCADCELNKWGSADTGRGKACRNRRRLAVIPAGTLAKDGTFTAYDDVDAFTKASVAYLNVPPTSINAYGAYVKQIATALRRPPVGVFTRVAVVPDPKTQIKITFEAIENVPDELLGAVIARGKAQQPQTIFPYQKPEGGGKGAKKKPKVNRKY